MRRWLAVAWLVMTCCTTLHAEDRLLARSLRIAMPAIFRIGPTSQAGVANDRFPTSFRRQTAPTFAFRLASSKGKFIVNEYAEHVESESSVADSEDERGSASLPDPEFHDDQSKGNIFPPVRSAPSQNSGEAILLDGASRKVESEADNTAPTNPPSGRNSFSWIAGTQNHLGMLELDFEPLSRVRYDAPAKGPNLHFDTVFGMKWLQGPISTDLPPALVNFQLNVGTSLAFSNQFVIDATISPAWYTDFSNKTSDAFRLPWQVVSYYQADSNWRWVLGITDLARRDIQLLPVFGTIYTPGSGETRWDLVFPKPRVAWRLSQQESIEQWFYVAGELGGGSWAISREDRAFDVVTYRDYRFVLGAERRKPSGHASRIEVGWVFGRAIEYRSEIGNYRPPDSVMLRMSADY